MAAVTGVQIPYFRRFTNAGTIATGAYDGSLNNQDDDTIRKWYNYLLVFNNSTEDILIYLDSNQTRGVFLPAGFSVELDGVAWFTTVLIYNNDSGTVAASGIQLHKGNRGRCWQEALQWDTTG